jgi:hypothetical protein
LVLVLACAANAAESNGRGDTSNDSAFAFKDFMCVFLTRYQIDHYRYHEPTLELGFAAIRVHTEPSAFSIIEERKPCGRLEARQGPYWFGVFFNWHQGEQQELADSISVHHLKFVGEDGTVIDESGAVFSFNNYPRRLYYRGKVHLPYQRYEVQFDLVYSQGGRQVTEKISVHLLTNFYSEKMPGFVRFFPT